jgi:hypothetical protein
MSFIESQTAIKANIEACERITGRPVTNGDYAYIAGTIGSLDRARMALALERSRGGAR